MHKFPTRGCPALVPVTDYIGLPNTILELMMTIRKTFIGFVTTLYSNRPPVLNSSAKHIGRDCLINAC